MSADELYNRHRRVMPRWATTYYRKPLHPEHAAGRSITDEQGHRYLDFFAGILTNSLGHGLKEFRRALDRRLDTGISHPSTLYLINAQVRLAEHLAAQSGTDDAAVFFVSSGTEANDTALLTATCHTNSNHVVALTDSYHGRSLATTSISPFGGNPLSCTAAPTALDHIREHDLQHNAETMGKRLLSCLRDLCGEHPHLSAPRGHGLMLAMDPVDPRTGEPDPRAADAYAEASRTQGLLIGLGGRHGNALRIAPPMTVYRGGGRRGRTRPHHRRAAAPAGPCRNLTETATPDRAAQITPRHTRLKRHEQGVTDAGSRDHHRDASPPQPDDHHEPTEGDQPCLQVKKWRPCAPTGGATRPVRRHGACDAHTTRCLVHESAGTVMAATAVHRSVTRGYRTGSPMCWRRWRSGDSGAKGGRTSATNAAVGVGPGLWPGHAGPDGVT